MKSEKAQLRVSSLACFLSATYNISTELNILSCCFCHVFCSNGEMSYWILQESQVIQIKRLISDFWLLSFYLHVCRNQPFIEPLAVVSQNQLLVMCYKQLQPTLVVFIIFFVVFFVFLWFPSAPLETTLGFYLSWTRLCFMYICMVFSLCFTTCLLCIPYMYLLEGLMEYQL